MTSATARRLTRLEGALPPREAVLAWLVEAQQFPSLEDHVRAIARLPVEAAPLSVIGARIEASVRASLKGQPHDTVRDAVRRAVGDGAFLFCLVLELNSQTVEIAKVEGLRAAATFFWMGAILGGPRAEELPAAETTTHRRECADAWAAWRTVVDRLRFDLHVENGARATLQRRFFAGQDVLFPDVSQAWADHVDTVERLVKLGDLLSTGGGPKPGRRSSGRSLAEAVAERVTRLADDARVHALEIMGDRPRAVAIMERRLVGSLD